MRLRGCLSLINRTSIVHRPGARRNFLWLVTPASIILDGSVANGAKWISRLFLEVIQSASRGRFTGLPVRRVLFLSFRRDAAMRRAFSSTCSRLMSVADRGRVRPDPDLPVTADALPPPSRVVDLFPVSHFPAKIFPFESHAERTYLCRYPLISSGRVPKADKTFRLKSTVGRLVSRRFKLLNPNCIPYKDSLS